MYVSRHLCAYLCIGSLLIGNAAGWLHLGCVESASPCCVEPDVDVAIAESGHRGCCHHSGDAPENQQQHSGPLDQDDSSEGSSEDAVPVKHDCPEHEEHDADRCSICQSFFASRHVVGVAATTIGVLEAPPAQFVQFVPHCVCVRGLLGNSISVRGPPRV